MTNRISDLQRAVQAACNCEAKHSGSQLVLEQFRGANVWDGVVEVFDLTGHPKAKRCYGWSFNEDGKPRYVTVLEIPPAVTSPSTAVRAAIAGGQQK